jgi:hypothetical protein
MRKNSCHFLDFLNVGVDKYAFLDSLRRNGVTRTQELLSQTAALLLQTEDLLCQSEGERERLTQLLPRLHLSQERLGRYFHSVYRLEMYSSVLLPDARFESRKQKRWLQE